MGGRILTDIVDQASEREAEFLAARLAEQQRAAALDAEGAAYCTECTEEIPAERRAALPSATRCVGCQAWIERIAGERRLRTP